MKKDISNKHGFRVSFSNKRVARAKGSQNFVSLFDPPAGGEFETNFGKSKRQDPITNNAKLVSKINILSLIFNILYFVGHPLYLFIKKVFLFFKDIHLQFSKFVQFRKLYKFPTILGLPKVKLPKIKKIALPKFPNIPKFSKIKKLKIHIFSYLLLTLSLRKVFRSLFLLFRFSFLVFNYIYRFFIYFSKRILASCFLIIGSFSRVSKKRFLFFFLLLIVSFIALDVSYLISFFRALPSASSLKTRIPPLTTKIYDRSGNLLYKIYDQKQNRTLVTLDELPDYLKKATISIEDKDFYKHGALSPLGIIRALRQNLIGQKQGGSTITQQLVKNIFLTPERTLERKLKEIILSIQVEMLFSKDEILTMYFNEVSFGGTAYGIEEASQTYFGKSASRLNLAESALLAGLPAAPTFYSPFGTNPERAINRQHIVLRRMEEDGYIANDQRLKAIQYQLNYAPQKTDIKAPHFVMFVKELLVNQYGEKYVEQGGLSVITSLDLNIQNLTQKNISEGVEKQKYLNVGNGAALVINPQTGEILAMVGSVNYFDRENDGNVNVVLMPRQPGSAIKPINYAAAFSLRKITPSTVIFDTPITFTYSGSPPYSPQNYDSHFRGKVTVRQALGSSLNVPAVKILNSYGVGEMIDLGKTLGISTWEDKSRFGLSLTLGGGEIKMLDLAQAFAVFANNGEKVNLKPILKIIDSQGKILANYTNEVDSQNVLSSGVAYLISNILADNNARSPVFGPNSPLFIPGYTVSVKTGTTETKKDNWTIGFTKDVLVAVWIGNNDSSPMSPYLESGYSGAAPIWRSIMDELLKNKKEAPLEVPSDIVKIEICKETGLPPCGPCTKVPEYYLSGTQPQPNCDHGQINLPR